MQSLLRVLDLGQTAMSIFVIEFDLTRALQDDTLRNLEFLVFHSARHSSVIYFVTFKSSTSKSSVEFGGINPLPTFRAP